MDSILDDYSSLDGKEDKQIGA